MTYRWIHTLSLATVLLVFVGVVAGTDSARASEAGKPGRIAYEDSVSGEIFVWRLDGAGPLRVTHDAGRYIGEVLDDEGNPMVLRTSNFAPVWKPGGDALTYLHVADVDRLELRQVNPDGDSMQILIRDWPGVSPPAWSPSGDRVAFGNEAGVWVADADGSDAVLIAAASRGQWPNTTDAPSVTIDVAWSGRGDRIAFIEDSGSGLVAGDQYLSIVDPDGSNSASEVCRSARDMDWAPDGEHLLVAGDCFIPDYGWGIIEITASGRPVRLLTNQGDTVAWAPYGETAVYAEYEIGMLQLSLESLEAWTVLKPFHGRHLAWQAIDGDFWDDDDSVFRNEIEWLYFSEITRGCNPPFNDRFCPDSVITRGQMAAFLVRALGLTDRLDDPFIDDDDSIFEADIERLAAAGITKGCNPSEGNTKFCPDGKVTREQMAAFLVRALHYTDDGGGDLFIDDDDSIFEGDIDRLGTAGVTKGCNPPTNDRFCPSGNVTRGQMAAFLHRALG
jgi:hypothetical protein